MANYQQPGVMFGRYESSVINMRCPLCSDGTGVARKIQGGSFQWKCDKGHTLVESSTPPPLSPVYDEPGAEQRILLTELQALKG